jgi:hypothetical protein
MDLIFSQKNIIIIRSAKLNLLFSKKCIFVIRERRICKANYAKVSTKKFFLVQKEGTMTFLSLGTVRKNSRPLTFWEYILAHFVDLQPNAH